MRILDTGLRAARWNVAMTAALAEMHARDAASDALRLHRYPASVLLGASQELVHAVDVSYCRRAGIEIARRVTGGGAVYMSPSMLAWDVLIDRRAHGGGLEAVTRAVCGGVAAGLSRLGVEARFRAPNDIAIGDRKVSGSSGYTVGRSAVLQGAILIADDVAEMARALCLPKTALRERMTCLATEIGSAPGLPEVAQCIASGVAEGLDLEPRIADLSDGEVALCEVLLREEMGTDAYVAGRRAARA